MPLISADAVRITALAALDRAGVPEGYAQLQADLLLEAELRGLASHGMLRLPRIIERIGNGMADPKVDGLHVWRAPGYLHVDGQRGLGPVVAMRALEAACTRAESQGVVIAAVANSNHLGMLAFYAEKVASKGKLLIALSTSEALVHAWGGRQAIIGTNPIAFGIPHDGGDFVADAATSLVAMGKIHDHANRNEPIPEGWALDANGSPTTDPHRAKEGALAPFGGPKGYALALSFELFVTALTGAALGREVRGTLDSTEVCNKGDVFIVVNAPRAALAEYLSSIRSGAPAEGHEAVRLPGERSRESRRRKLEMGITLPDEIWMTITKMAGRQQTGEGRTSE